MNTERHFGNSGALIVKERNGNESIQADEREPLAQRAEGEGLAEGVY
jgi:hypothetical protein